MPKERHMSLCDVTVEIDDEPVHYLEAGAGWPVLLLHGFPLSADMWRAVLDGVPDGWRFIAPDLAGFRGPDTPVRADAPVPAVGTLDDYARRLGRLLDLLEIDRAVIGGVSMGGYVTFAMFRLQAERFSWMILADTRAAADTPEGRAGRAKMRDLLRDRGPSAIADRMLPTLLGTTTKRERPEVMDHVRRLIEANPAQALDQALAAMMDRPDSTADLARISCPVLVVCGEEDELIPAAESERLQRAVPRSMLTLLPAAGHLSPLERPEAFTKALTDFLASNL
jgi:3-oxoadipate enol-lactonase